MLYQELASNIATQLNIHKDKSESNVEWKARLFYSAAGRWALSSLWDRGDDVNEDISVQHIKNKYSELLKAYVSLHSELTPFFANSLNDLADDVYDIYNISGQIYHRPNRIIPASFTQAEYQNVFFVRGISPGDSCWMSGIGFYKNDKEISEKLISINQAFSIPELPLQQWWTKFNNNRGWRNAEAPDGIEYLRTDKKYNYGYWQIIPDVTDNPSMARYGMKGQESYVLYKFDGRHLAVSDLPDWHGRRINTSNRNGAPSLEYLRIATAILQSKGALPIISVKTNSSIVEIKLGYRLPPAEETFFKLYGWPAIFTSVPQHWNRRLTISVYPAFKSIIENLGYKVMEV